MITEVQRPIVRYHGGKWLLAPWIISHFPEHRVYVEPFGGGGSVLLRKSISYAEVYNDLDKEIVNLFEVVRNHGDELRRLIELTPFSREDFSKSYQRSRNAVEQARRTIVRSFMGFGSNSLVRNVGFRAQSNRSGTTPAKDWKNYPESIRYTIERLRGVIIENRAAAQVILQHDSPDTLFYIDPPYLASTRGRGRDYHHEMTDRQHRALAKVLRSVSGMVIISGYASELYDQELYPDFRREETRSFAGNGKDRTEVLWLSPNVPPQQFPLFSPG